jgi:hypothetical protein
MNFEVEGQTGFLVLGLDGAVLNSGGDLQSDERSAGAIFQIVETAAQGLLESNKITINYADHTYVICSSNNKIHVVKKNTNSCEVLA